MFRSGAECIIGFDVLVDVVIEQRFYRCNEGKYWTDNAFPNAFWHRYLNVFDAVNIVARVQKVERPEELWQRVDSDTVGFTDLPIYIGPAGFIKKLPDLIKVLKTRKLVNRCVIYRVPGILSFFYHLFAMPSGKAYAAEVVGDPVDVFAPGASKSPLRPVFKRLFYHMLRRQCAKAVSLSYVTEYSLQERYPPNPDGFDTHYSSIQLGDSDYFQRSEYTLNRPIKLVCIGNLSQPYKGCDFMLETLAKLKSKGVEVYLSWIGGGALQPAMESLADELGIAQSVRFVGNLSQRAQINQILDDSDVFVLSSRQEGLPRVLIESMARSLVCVATNVGGVKELLPQTFIVERDNQTELIDVLESVMLKTSQELMEISQANYTKAQNYHNDVLAERRKNMYQALLESSV